MRTLVTGTIVLLSCLVLAAAAPAAEPKVAAKSPAAAPATSRVVAYYFHGDRRCPTCMSIESTTARIVKERFSNELKSKSLEWRVVNFDRPENEHVIKDYGLVAQSVVLVEYDRDGRQVRFKNLDKVWRLIHQGNEFELYVRYEISQFLNPHV